MSPSAEGAGSSTAKEATGNPRFHALDSVRAVAMLLGIVFHALMFGGGTRGMMGGEGGADVILMNWLHSFRMALFFLVGGFFSAMMFRKYSVRQYLQRRWMRLGAAMVIYLFGLAAVLELKDYAAGRLRGAARLQESSEGIGAEGRGPRAAGLEAELPGAEGRGEVRVGGEEGSFGERSPMAEKLFGRFAGHFRMGPMWFLWFLIVFATVGAGVSWAAESFFTASFREHADRFGRSLLGRGLAPLVLAVASIPALWVAGTPPGQPPAGGSAIVSSFPDVLFQYHPDYLYFFVFFMSGWMIYRFRDQLTDLGRFWVPCLTLGIVAHFVTGQVEVRPSPFAAGPELAAGKRFGIYLIFSISSAFTSFGFLGFFQRYLDRPGKVSRYLADTAFWFYLVHQELLIRVILPRLERYHLPWMLQTAIALGAVAVVASVTFEIFIRRTPLTNVFGPPRPKNWQGAMSRRAIPAGDNAKRD